MLDFDFDVPLIFFQDLNILMFNKNVLILLWDLNILMFSWYCFQCFAISCRSLALFWFSCNLLPSLAAAAKLASLHARTVTLSHPFCYALSHSTYKSVTIWYTTKYCYSPYYVTLCCTGTDLQYHGIVHFFCFVCVCVCDFYFPEP